MENRFLVKGPVTPEIIGAYLLEMGKRTDSGGHSIFMGQVRDDQSGEGRVKEIEYSAYEDMVAAEAEKIIRITREAFSDVKLIEILHATGTVKCGEISLFVMVTAGHRDQAMRACRHIVEMIKLNYPVWKKEILDNDSHRWRENEH